MKFNDNGTFLILLWLVFFLGITLTIHSKEANSAELILWPKEGSEKVELLIGQWSDHEIKGEYNEKHDLIGIEYADIGLAKFTNSDGDKSYILGYTPEYHKGPYLDFKVTYGLVHGYEKVKLFPIVIPGVTLHYKDFPVKLDINYVPFVVWTAGFRLTF